MNHVLIQINFFYLYLNNKFNIENFVSFKIEKFNLKEKVMIKSTAVALALITVTTASMVKSKPKYNTKDGKMLTINY